MIAIPTETTIICGGDKHLFSPQRISVKVEQMPGNDDGMYLRVTGYNDEPQLDEGPHDIFFNDEREIDEFCATLKRLLTGAKTAYKVAASDGLG